MEGGVGLGKDTMSYTHNSLTVSPITNKTHNFLPCYSSGFCPQESTVNYMGLFRDELKSQKILKMYILKK